MPVPLLSSCLPRGSREFRCGFGAVLGGWTGGARSDFSIPHYETMRVSCVDGGWRGFGDDALRGNVMSELAWAGVATKCRNGKIVENSRKTAFDDVFGKVGRLPPRASTGSPGEGFGRSKRAPGEEGDVPGALRQTENWGWIRSPSTPPGHIGVLSERTYSGVNLELSMPAHPTALCHRLEGFSFIPSTLNITLCGAGNRGFHETFSKMHRQS